jgi:LuxR family transcriptional regulator, maltose regulon positive regulatory protein
LEAGDNDPARFWMYVIEALRSVVPGIGEAALAVLRAPGLNLVDEALAALVNELADVSEQFVLVLDDYHAIDDERVHEGMGSLIEHLPAALRIVMATRAEPPLRVGRLRARGWLNEIDAAQLQFSLVEAEAMLNDVHGLRLSPETVERLHSRTEGWAAGLYLAVLSMRRRGDASGFVESFTGSDRRIVDYLAAEVLGEQREATRGTSGTGTTICSASCSGTSSSAGSRAVRQSSIGERAVGFSTPGWCPRRSAT